MLRVLVFRPAEKVKSALAEFAGYGPDASYLLPRWVFLRLLGVIGFAAFLGWFRDGPALIGPDGILPSRILMTNVVQENGFLHALLLRPSLLWFSSSAWMILAVSALGMAASAALLLNFY